MNWQFQYYRHQFHKYHQHQVSKYYMIPDFLYSHHHFPVHMYFWRSGNLFTWSHCMFDDTTTSVFVRISLSLVAIINCPVCTSLTIQSCRGWSFQYVDRFNVIRVNVNCNGLNNSPAPNNCWKGNHFLKLHSLSCRVEPTNYKQWLIFSGEWFVSRKRILRSSRCSSWRCNLNSRTLPDKPLTTFTHQIFWSGHRLHLLWNTREILSLFDSKSGNNNFIQFKNVWI